MNSQDFSKALNYAGKDPDIDVQEFEHFLARSASQFSDSENGSNNKFFKGFEDVEHGITNHVFSGSQGGNGRTRMRPSFMRDQASNDPSETDEHEAFNLDSIPFATYKKMAIDPQIILGLFLLKGWVGGLKYKISCPDIEMEAVMKHSLGLVWKKLIRNLVDSVIFGFQFGEKVWQREDVELPHPVTPEPGKLVFSGTILNYKKIKFLDPSKDFKFYKNESDEITKVVQRNRRGEVSIPRDKLVWFALDERYSGIFGTSRLKAVYSTWYYAQVTNQLLLRDNEQRGAPHLEVRFPIGSTVFDGEPVDNSLLAARYAQSIKSSGVVILPSSVDDKGNHKWSVAYADTKRASDSSPFMDYIQYADSRKLSAIGIPAAVLGDATFGQADAQGDLLLVIIEDIISQIEDVIQKDVVRQLVEFNWGPKEVSKVKLTIDRSSLGRKRLFKEILIHVLRIASSREGLNPKNLPDIAGMCEDLDIPIGNFADMFVKADPAAGEKSASKSPDPMDEWENDIDSNGVDRIQEPDRSEDYRKNKSDSFKE